MASQRGKCGIARKPLRRTVLDTQRCGPDGSGCAARQRKRGIRRPERALPDRRIGPEGVCVRPGTGHLPLYRFRLFLLDAGSEMQSPPCRSPCRLRTGFAGNNRNSPVRQVSLAPKRAPRCVRTRRPAKQYPGRAKCEEEYVRQAGSSGKHMTGSARGRSPDRHAMTCGCRKTGPVRSRRCSTGHPPGCTGIGTDIP